jgi:MFS family permease
MMEPSRPTATGPLRRALAGMTSDLLPASGPSRRVALSQVGDALGFGVNVLALPLFLMQIIHLPPLQVGLAFSIGGLTGVWAGILIGHLADRRGLRGVLVCMYLFHFVVAVLAPFVNSLGTAAALVCLTSFAFEGSRAVRHAVIARLGGSERARFRAQLRSISNIGMALGSVLAGLAVQLDTWLSYSLALWTKAAMLLLAACLQSTLPQMQPLALERDEGAGQDGKEQSSTGLETTQSVALRDLPYVTMSMLNAALHMSGQILTLALPLWIASRKVAPGWTSSALLLFNTMIVVVLQVRMTRHIDSASAAARSWVLAGRALLLSCLLIAVTNAVSPAWAVVLLFTAIAMFTAAEMWHAAGSFELALSLAPAHAQAQYQGVFNLGEGLGVALAPTLLTFLCVTWGTPGWVLLGAWLAVCGALGPRTVRWVQRTRPRTGRSQLVDVA